MKKLLILSLAAIGAGANAAIIYDNTDAGRAWPFYFPAQAQNKMADDIETVGVGPVNVLASTFYAPAGYTGDLEFTLGDRTPDTNAPPLSIVPPGPALVTLLVPVNLTGNFAWDVTVVCPVVSLPDNTACLGMNYPQHIGTGGPGTLLGLDPLIGTSPNNFGYAPGGTWGNYFFGAANKANFGLGAAGIGTLFIETTTGTEIAGDINSVQFSDDEYYTAFPFEDLPNDAVIHGTGDCLNGAPTAIDFVVEYSVGRPGLSYSFRLWNTTANAFQQKLGGVAATADETVTYQNTTTASQYVTATGGYEFQLVFQPINEEDPAQDGWPLNVDYIEVIDQS